MPKNVVATEKDKNIVAKIARVLCVMQSGPRMRRQTFLGRDGLEFLGHQADQPHVGSCAKVYVCGDSTA